MLPDVQHRVVVARVVEDRNLCLGIIAATCMEHLVPFAEPWIIPKNLSNVERDVEHLWVIQTILVKLGALVRVDAVRDEDNADSV